MKPTTRDGVLRGGRAAIIRLLILAAAGISAYLLSVSLSGGSAVGCGPGSACDEVLQSRWAYVLGVPVSALALIVDLAILLTTFGCGRKSSPKQRRSAWEILVPCSVLVLGAALWFMALQAFVLHRFCPWCSAAHACGAVAAILLLARVPVTDSRERREKEAALSRTKAINLAVIAVMAIALLGVAQVVAPRKTYSVASVPNINSQVGKGTPNWQANKSPDVLLDPRTNTTASLASANAVKTALTNAPVRTLESLGFLQILGDRMVLDLNKAPIWGSPNAPAKLVSLYDYTCHHCRDMHPHVVDLHRTFSNKLAIINLPMPLDSQCNPLVRQTPRAHGSACTYAKLGLIVWRARRAAMEPFDDWIFSFPNPPPLTEVTNKAVALVGFMAFDIASRDPWIEEQLKTNVGIYGITAKEFNKGAMPQFIIGSNIVSGILNAGQMRQFVAPYVDAAQ